MSDRQLIPDATAPLRTGDEVVTPSGRRAFVEAIDAGRGEVVVRWPSELGQFRRCHLRRADVTEGGGLVFLQAPDQDEAANDATDPDQAPAAEAVDQEAQP